MNEIKKHVMEILNQNRLNNNIKEIPNIFGIDEDGNYYHMVIDYPGDLYKQIVYVKNDEEFVKYIVREMVHENQRTRGLK